MYSKFFDYEVPLFHYLHFGFDTAAAVGRLGTPKSYHFPHEMDNHPETFPATYFGFDPDVTKEQVLQANLDLVKYGLVLFTWGNVSAVDRDSGLVVIKPSGVPYDAMTAGDMVVVDFDGKVVEGHYKPSSDMPTHIELYRSFPGVGSVVHTHSKCATAWAQAGLDIPNIGTTHADYFHREIPCTRDMTPEEIAGEYERQTGRVIVERFAGMNSCHTPGVLVKNHGPFTWGATCAEAVHNSVVLEEIATMAAVSLSINPDLTMNPGLIEKHFNRKHGAGAYYGQK